MARTSARIVVCKDNFYQDYFRVHSLGYSESKTLDLLIAGWVATPKAMLAVFVLTIRHFSK